MTRLTPRGNSIIISGSKEHCIIAEKMLHVMSDYLEDKPENYEFDRYDLKYLVTLAKSGEKINFAAINRLKIYIPESKKSVYPKSLNQIHYLSEIDKKAVTFAIGPAGTGKTYLAVAAALKEYYNGNIRRIVLTRPAVEAGESLGFLPGDLVQKINPYLRPLYDALFDLVSFEKIEVMIEKNIIEIAPLAYMRGRTLNDAFIILDEAQNTTASQMKMFLTRLGNNSKMVISGDITQIDIEKPKRSGLLLVRKILRKVNDVSFVEFNSEDICRHPVVEQIINAYDEFSGEH
ncbi:MAG: PhoH family protein [Spirochaetes bacterium]|nr:PhoH family protein [Spirochaetota bacterium]MBN2769823.1 PhoH family protein [Spirochaetota bacterium]